MKFPLFATVSVCVPDIAPTIASPLAMPVSIAVAFLFVLSQPTTVTVVAPAVKSVTRKVSAPPVVITSPILNFSVDALIEVDFTQDEDTGEYLIHLEPGEGSQTDYSMTFERQEGQTTDIAFVNYYSSDSGRVTTSTNRRRRPEVSVGESD